MEINSCLDITEILGDVQLWRETAMVMTKDKVEIFPGTSELNSRACGRGIPPLFLA